MKTIFSILLALSITLTVTTVQAADTCSEGTIVSLRGEINNNAVAVEHPGGYGQYTLGIADLKLNDGKHEVRLNCVLLGEPTGETDPSGYQYDHMIVCDDEQQSEVAFMTRTVEQDTNPTNVLKKAEIENFCREAYLGFVERNKVNGDRQSKGLFQNASGVLRSAGCVNIMNANNGEIIVNMGVKGDLCLPNWHW